MYEDLGIVIVEDEEGEAFKEILDNRQGVEFKKRSLEQWVDLIERHLVHARIDHELYPDTTPLGREVLLYAATMLFEALIQTAESEELGEEMPEGLEEELEYREHAGEEVVPTGNFLRFFEIGFEIDERVIVVSVPDNTTVKVSMINEEGEDDYEANSNVDAGLEHWRKLSLIDDLAMGCE